MLSFQISQIKVRLVARITVQGRTKEARERKERRDRRRDKGGTGGTGDGGIKVNKECRDTRGIKEWKDTHDSEECRDTQGIRE